MTKRKPIHDIIKFTPFIPYILAHMIDQFIMSKNILYALGVGLFAACFMFFIVEGWGLLVLELYLILSPEKWLKYFGVVIVLLACGVSGVLTYYMNEFIFSFDGSWNAGKWMVVYLNVFYALVAMIVMLKPTKKQETIEQPQSIENK